MKTIPANSIIIYRTDSKLRQLITILKGLICKRKFPVYHYTIQYIKDDTVVFGDTSDMLVYTCIKKYSPNKDVLFQMYNYRTDAALNLIYCSFPDDIKFKLLVDYEEAICLINSTKNWQRSTI